MCITQMLVLCCYRGGDPVCQVIYYCEIGIVISIVAIQMAPAAMGGGGTSSGGMVAPMHQLPPSHLVGSQGKSMANSVSCTRLSETCVFYFNIQSLQFSNNYTLLMLITKLL